MKTPRIGITMGDPAGVGPELCSALLQRGRDALDNVIMFADLAVLSIAHRRATGQDVPSWAPLRDRGVLSAGDIDPGVPNVAGAQAQVAYLEAAADAARQGTLDAIVTAPVNKAQCRRAGLTTPGQTEFFAQRLDAKEVAMMFAGPRCRVVLVTIHVPLAEVPGQCTRSRIVAMGSLGVASLNRDFAIECPRVGVLGLNPHAGENGLLGREEIEVIAPAIGDLRERFPDAEFHGPLPPDAAFHTAAAHPTRFDLLISMYHDQALGPLKVLDFEGTSNVTLGLPVVRTSPDHGVAYDIAGTGTATAVPFLSAFDLARTLAGTRLSQAVDSTL